MDIKKYLQNSFIDLGLSKKAGKVYFNILGAKGRADASYIKKGTRSSTAGVYRIIGRLIAKGFILSSSGNRPATYTAIPFYDLAKKFEAKKDKFSKISDRLKKLSEL